VKKFVGVDLHKRVIVICVVNKQRDVLTSRRFNCAESHRIREWFASLDEFEVVVEATASYEWFVQLIEDLAARVVLAHPAKLRIIAESTRKSDKLDARVLAEFLALDMIPDAHRATPRQRQQRRLVRRRYYLRRRITSIKNRLRNIVADYNADRRDLFTASGRAAAKQLPLLPADRFALEELWMELDFHQERMAAVQKQIQDFAKDAPQRESEARRLLDSIPGVGPVTIEAFIAEVGDVRRFGSQKKVAAYVGLAPGSRESAGKRHDLRITKCGSGLLRWTLGQAAWRLVSKSARWQRIHEQIAKRRGKKKAIVAVTRRLLCMMVAILTTGRPYHAAA
jgi:transposase